MIYWELLLGFLKIGCFAFGGAYSAIPLLRDAVLSYGWLSDEALTDMIAVSESTPGPIIVNLATYVGSSQAGLAGAALATTAVVLPSCFVILLVTSLLRRALKNKYIQAVLRGVKPCMVGMILATGVYMTFHRCFPMSHGWPADIRTLLITAGLAAAMLLYRYFRKRKLSPILLIVLAAFLGIAIY